MRKPFQAKITGLGSCFPERRLTNNDLSRLVDTSDEWIFTRTGIRERRIAQPGRPEDFNSSMALAAAQQALEMAGRTPANVDQIILATVSPDTIVPSTSCWLQAKLEAWNAWCFDLNAACSGFLYGLSIANQFVCSGQVKTSLVIGSEVMSGIVNWQDRNTCVLFGDGAGAFVVESAPEDSFNRIYSTHLGTNGAMANLIQIPSGGTREPLTAETLTNGKNKVCLQGGDVYKEAVNRMVEYAQIALNHNGLSVKDLDWFIPHQANLRIIEAAAKRLDFPMERVLVNIERHGNTSAASIPLLFNEAVRDGRIQPGNLILLDAFGAGATFGSVLLRF